LQPGNVDALHMLGMLRHQQGDVAEALRLLDLALAFAPENPNVLANRAAVHLGCREHAAAERDAALAVARAPQLAGGWMNLGLALDGLGRHAQAAAAFARAAALRPDDARMLLAWFGAAARSGRTAGLAERSRIKPPMLAAERDDALRTAFELAQHGFSNQALYLLSQLRAELPDDADVAFRHDIEMRYRHASRLEAQQHATAALRAADELITAAPWHRGARMLRAALHEERGDPSAALTDYRQILEQVPDDPVAGSAYLLALQYDPASGAQALADAHRAWAARHVPVIAPRWQLPAGQTERPLRVAWLSPRFFSGLAETFFLPALEQFDRGVAQHHLYDSAGVDDAVTARFRRAADGWHDVSALDDEGLCARLRADRIDILVELTGHGPGNRLRALAARPAPVQISWLDYFHSTGTTAIDVIWSDRVLSPARFAGYYTEHVEHLPSGRLCYTPPGGAPRVTSRATGQGLRLACFNRVAKINDRVLVAWSRILEQLPDSVLSLKARAFDDASQREYFLARCARIGIAQDRVELCGYGTHVEALAAYADVDIALDPFPFSGCATSCDALWMGVPVVTMAGDTMVSRQTASLLVALGYPELIADDGDAYVAVVLRLAADHGRTAMRAELRDRMLERLGNVPRHAREIERALQKAWENFTRPT
jgi:predicted O-linked N-acetylglucosamine transferase (SPINDLY family)